MQPPLIAPFGGIYKIECRKNGKIYIGKAKDIESRAVQHIYMLNCNRHENYFLRMDWQKYGKDAFYFSALERIDSAEKRKLRERKIINWFKPNVLYNVSHIPENYKKIKVIYTKTRQEDFKRLCRDDPEFMAELMND